jgi:hypothetical protein
VGAIAGATYMASRKFSARPGGEESDEGEAAVGGEDAAD